MHPCWHCLRGTSKKSHQPALASAHLEERDLDSCMMSSMPVGCQLLDHDITPPDIILGTFLWLSVQLSRVRHGMAAVRVVHHQHHMPLLPTSAALDQSFAACLQQKHAFNFTDVQQPWHSSQPGLSIMPGSSQTMFFTSKSN